MLRFETDDNFTYKPKLSRSRYRDLVLNVLEHFVSNPDKRVVKLTFEFGADATNAAKQCNRWLKDEEGLIITMKGKSVYFLRS